MTKQSRRPVSIPSAAAITEPRRSIGQHVTELKYYSMVMTMILSIILQAQMIPTRAEVPMFFCPSYTANYHDQQSNASSNYYTKGSEFEKNLNALLPSLAKNGALNIETFFNDSSGSDGPDRVFGFSQCMSNATLRECQKCLNNAAAEIIQGCANQREAAVRYYQCLLRYFSSTSSSSRYGKAEFSEIKSHYNVEGLDQARFDPLLFKVMKDISSVAASRPSRISTAEVPYTGTTNFYGLAQCTRDLGSGECSNCLRHLIANVACCDRKQGGLLFAVSCNIRYEIYPFYPAAKSTSHDTTNGNLGNKGHKKRLIIIVVASITVVAASISIILIYLLLRGKSTNRISSALNLRENRDQTLFDMKQPSHGTNKKDNNSDGGSGNQVDDHGLPLISLASILSATGYFSHASLLGQGGFGPVYKGKLPDGKEVAVKRLARSSGQGPEEFKNEVILIAKLQHRNLVRLLGCCIEDEEKLLVYEYMSNGSLDVLLFDRVKRAQLDWRRRLQIVGGVARGLLYLHEDSRLKIIHRDLKASNILLDNEMNPKISDFGMARIFGGNQNQANTNRVVGTYGYMSPEYAMAGLFSVKSDVFSFGILLLEIVSGKRNMSQNLPEDEPNLLTYAWRLWCDGRALELTDKLIYETCSTNQIFRCIHIALLCVQEDPANRPTMSSVLLMLGSDSVALPKPTTPGFFLGKAVDASHHSSSDARNCSANITISEIGPR